MELNHYQICKLLLLIASVCYNTHASDAGTDYNSVDSTIESQSLTYYGSEDRDDIYSTQESLEITDCSDIIALEAADPEAPIGSESNPTEIPTSLESKQIVDIMTSLPNGTAFRMIEHSSCDPENSTTTLVHFKQNEYFLNKVEYEKFLGLPDGGTMRLRNKDWVTKHVPHDERWESKLLPENVYLSLDQKYFFRSPTELYIKVGKDICTLKEVVHQVLSNSDKEAIKLLTCMALLNSREAIRTLCQARNGDNEALLAISQCGAFSKIDYTSKKSKTAFCGNETAALYLYLAATLKDPKSIQILRRSFCYCASLKFIDRLSYLYGSIPMNRDGAQWVLRQIATQYEKNGSDDAIKIALEIASCGKDAVKQLLQLFYSGEFKTIIEESTMKPDEEGGYTESLQVVIYDPDDAKESESRYKDPIPTLFASNSSGKLPQYSLHDIERLLNIQLADVKNGGATAECLFKDICKAEQEAAQELLMRLSPATTTPGGSGANALQGIYNIIDMLSFLAISGNGLAIRELIGLAYHKPENIINALLKILPPKTPLTSGPKQLKKEERRAARAEKMQRVAAKLVDEGITKGQNAEKPEAETWRAPHMVKVLTALLQLQKKVIIDGTDFTVSI